MVDSQSHAIENVSQHMPHAVSAAHWLMLVHSGDLSQVHWKQPCIPCAAALALPVGRRCCLWILPKSTGAARTGWFCCRALVGKRKARLSTATLFRNRARPPVKSANRSSPSKSSVPMRPRSFKLGPEPAFVGFYQRPEHLRCSRPKNRGPRKGKRLAWQSGS